MTKRAKNKILEIITEMIILNIKQGIELGSEQTSIQESDFVINDSLICLIEGIEKIDYLIENYEQIDQKVWKGRDSLDLSKTTEIYEAAINQVMENKNK